MKQYTRTLCVSLLAVAAGAAAMVAAPGQAEACTIWTNENGIELHFPPGEPVVYYIQADGSADLPGADDFDAIHAAFEAWSSVVCGDQDSGLVFEFGGVLDTDPNNFDPRAFRDQKNMVAFVNENWQGNPNSLARARILWNSDTGEIEEFGIALNDEFTDWATDGNPMAFDVQSVLMRQIGLAFGLGDSEFESSVMFPGFRVGDTSKRTLGNDDVLAVCDLYAPGREDYSEIPEDAECARDFHPGAVDNPDPPPNNDPNNMPNNDPGNNDPGNNDPGNNDPGNNEPPPSDLGPFENCTDTSQCAEGLICGCPTESCAANVCHEPEGPAETGSTSCTAAATHHPSQSAPLGLFLLLGLVALRRRQR